MKRILLPGLFFITTIGSASAQWNDAIVDNNLPSKVTIGAYGNADYASNAITSKFAYNFIKGSYLDSTLKNSVSSKLQKENRLGYELNYGLYAVVAHDTIRHKRVFNFFFALRHKDYFNASFTNDDFNLAFGGNASYAGKTAIISPLVTNSLIYQQAEIGLVCTNFGGGAQFGVGFSFLAGQQYMGFNASSASLYTDTYGQSLLLNSNAQFWQSDTSKGYLTRLNGTGASMDVYFSAPYLLGKRKKKGVISVSVTDIGFIWWNKNSLSYQKDTAYSYNGITINSISDLQNANFNSLSKDSLKNKYFLLKKGGFYAPIPTQLKINTNTALCQKFHLQLGYWYLFNANDIGYIYAQGDKYFSHNWILSLQAGYGDYNGINGALLLSKQFKCSKLSIAVNHLQGIAVPAQYGGAGAYAEYTYSFAK